MCLIQKIYIPPAIVPECCIMHCKHRRCVLEWSPGSYAALSRPKGVMKKP